MNTKRPFITPKQETGALICSLMAELEKTKAELNTLKNNIVHLKKKAAEIVALGEKQDECDIHEWYSMSPAPYLAELENFVEDIAELEERNES